MTILPPAAAARGQRSAAQARDRNRRYRRRPRIWLLLPLLVIAWSAQSPLRAAQPKTVVDVLRALIATGVAVLYSTDLVPPTQMAPEHLEGTDPMSRAIEALAAHDLVLHSVGPRSFVVTRRTVLPNLAQAPPSAPAPLGAMAIPATLDEVSVFGTRYELPDSTMGEPIGFDARSMKQSVGSDADPLRSLKSAPGLATNLSARPYIRGAMLDDMLVEYDGIPLADPFHFKDFQSVLSVFDPSTVSRAELFTGGFPVAYGTRSGGVLELTPRSVEAGSEFVAGASTLDYDLGSVGRAASRPIDWLFTLRTSVDHSTVQPLTGVYGEPRFSDGVGRLRWAASDSSDLTLGAIILNDRIALAAGAEQTMDLSRDLDAWLRWEWRPSGALISRTSVALGNTERNTSGQLELAGLAQGTLDSERSFTTRGLYSRWTYASSDHWRWDFGGEVTRENADLTFIRNETFAAPVMLGFGQPANASIVSITAPRSVVAGLYASALRRWQGWEAQAGVRLDEQSYRGVGSRGQLSPRFNLRYELKENWQAYGSAGQFDQAQRVDEYRAEQNQTTPDAATRALHVLVGIVHGGSEAPDWRLEAYRNHWSSVSPYYDNLLGSVSLTPQLSPDRVLISPIDAEAAGIELTARHSFGRGVEAWSVYSFSKVADDIRGGYVARSWDQRHAANLGISWANERSAISALVGWHSGWPMTPLVLHTANPGAVGYWAAGVRNSASWGSYLSADLRASTSVRVAHGEMSFWVDAGNVTDRANPCCAELSLPAGGAGPEHVLDRYWAPRVINVGFSFRIRQRR